MFLQDPLVYIWGKRMSTMLEAISQFNIHPSFDSHYSFRETTNKQTNKKRSWEKPFFCAYLRPSFILLWLKDCFPFPFFDLRMFKYVMYSSFVWFISFYFYLITPIGF